MKKFIFIIIPILLISNTISSQDRVEIEDIKYRRSSLHTILIELPNIPFKDVVVDAYNNAPFPEKYNNHLLEEKSFDPKKYTLTNEERDAAGLKSRKAEGKADTLAQRKKEMPLKIKKYFKDKKIANQIVAKWFNRQPDGSFDMELVAERGFYNATEMEEAIAQGSVRGMASIADAGEELIKNTFVIVSTSAFLDNEVTASAIRATAYTAAEILGGYGSSLAKIAADVVYKATKDGYSVWTSAHLYQLKWNDSISNIFYNELWMDKSNVDSIKKIAFDESNIFELEHVGSEKANTLVTMWNKNKGNSKKKKSNKKKKSRKERKTDTTDGIINTDEEYIAKATSTNLRRVFIKLQKEYDVFKTKTPLLTGYPITARIGKKEGLKGGEKFEVFERIIDRKTGLTKYEKRGDIKVDKKLIWDNRTITEITSENSEPTVTFTTFKGKKNFKSGMLIRQKK